MTKKRSLLFLFATWCSVAAAIETPHPEHAIWIRLETEPTGATLYAVPAEGERPTVRLGTTPCMIAADLNWGYRWLRKRWDALRIQSPGSICSAEFLPEKKYNIDISFIAVKNGYQQQRFDRRLLTLQNPGKNWEGKRLWPSQTSLTVPLTPAPKDEAGDPDAARATRKVILADSESSHGDGMSGVLMIQANLSDCQAFVDKKFVGTTPVQVILKSGRHTVQVQRDGYQPVQKEIYVNDDAEVAYRAFLEPVQKP